MESSGGALLTLANEPTVGLFYIQEHYRGTIRSVHSDSVYSGSVMNGRWMRSLASLAWGQAGG